MILLREIVEVMFDDDFGGNHPAIVLSNKLVQEVEGYFVCVMMTSSRFDDEFSFVITDDMLMKPLNKNYAEARCHLISFVPFDAIIRNRNINQIKINSFKELMEKINNTTFYIGEL